MQIPINKMLGAAQIEIKSQLYGHIFLQVNNFFIFNINASKSLDHKYQTLQALPLDFLHLGGNMATHTDQRIQIIIAKVPEPDGGQVSIKNIY